MNQSATSGALTGRKAVAICAVAIGLSIAASTTTPFVLFDSRSSNHAAVHLLLELFSVVVSCMVAAMAWHSVEPSEQATSELLVAGFTLVAGMDLFHSMSYEGMPSLLSDSSTAKAIYFWIGGRWIEVLTVILIASGTRVFTSKGQALVWSLMLLAIFFWVGTYHLDTLPNLYLAATGVTPLKAGIEYLLFSLNMIAAAWIFFKPAPFLQSRRLWLATACFLTGIGELMFTSYVTTSEFTNVFGHFYKVAAYTLIYCAAFHASVRAPYELLTRSAKVIDRQRADLSRLLRNVPADLVLLSRQMHLLYANESFLRRMGTTITPGAEARWEDATPAIWRQAVDPQLTRALDGKRVELDFEYDDSGGIRRSASMVAVPEVSDHGIADGVLAIFSDTTEREQARKRLAASLKELTELRVALDAHAIVAVTDAKGIITRVNEKFCVISKYSEVELIGNSHRVINSGFHPKSFFANLWRTISRGNVWNGEICNRAKDGTLYWVYTTIVPFVSSDGEPVQYIAIRADITERKNAEQDAQRMAFYDVLTGLPNRRLMNDRLRVAMAAAIRTEVYGALLLLDLDNFKEVNDSLGHDQGDELLRQVSSRIKACVRQVDTVARMGGDEFVVIFSDLGVEPCEATVRASNVAEKIRLALAATYSFNGLSVESTPSMGLVMFSDGSVDKDELLKRADMALYRAKAQGRNRVCLFDPSLQADVHARAQLLSELRQAIAGGEFRLHYQPIVDARRATIGYEALIRWTRPGGGLAPPAQFIPLAEQTGLILPLGQWVLKTACEQLKAWQQTPRTACWTISINVSARQFRDHEFVASVQNELLNAGAEPSRLRIELTESMLHADLDETVSKIEALRSIGVRFALDDFGTGYSSLSYLKRLPIDQLKIDRSFVNDISHDPNDAAIARTVIALAQQLGLNVVAEGVETMEQFEFLKAHQCDAFQGYLFGRPEPIEAQA